MDKSVGSVEDAVRVVRDGDSVALGGFGVPGSPVNLMRALCATSVADLEVISNAGGVSDWQLGQLMRQGRVRRIIASHIGGNKELIHRVGRGEIELELIPQGTFAERLRAGGAGIPAFYTPTGVDTWIETGTPLRYAADGSVERRTPPKERRTIQGVDVILENAIIPDVSLVRATVGDRHGNLVYSGSTENFNTAMAMAGRTTIAEVERLVEPGEIPPSAVHTPGVFVDMVVEVGSEGKWHERLVTVDADRGVGYDELSRARRAIAYRAAQDLTSGIYVNLGVGIPTLIPEFLPPDLDVHFQSENGLVGIGPPPTRDVADFDLTNAGKETTTLLAGASISDSSVAFAMIRGGHIDKCILGAMQVSQAGDLASWAVPGRAVSGMGGAMDLVTGARDVIVTMLHTDNSGVPKIVEECTYPLTGKGVIRRIITELAVIDVSPDGLVLRELAAEVTVDQVRQVTAAKLQVQGPIGTMMAPNSALRP